MRQHICEIMFDIQYQKLFRMHQSGSLSKRIDNIRFVLLILLINIVQYLFFLYTDTILQ